ncbi:MAG: hypothetical protein U0175_11620 [Caldilineaceae bacterium]
MNPTQPTKATVQHVILLDGTKIHEFLDAAWYDTATPYRGCLRELQRLYDLTASHSLEIVSYGKSYKIATQADFRHWVAEVFEQGGNFGFAKRLLT